jgi:uncharacterized membrane protein YhaH (DUF805 family)
MTFTESISTCFAKYATFTGRASRSEFWWFYLFCFIVNLPYALLQQLNLSGAWDLIFNLISLAVLIPNVAVTTRRLHDINKSGWWQLIWLTIIGIIVLIYWEAQEGTEGENRFGLQ